MEAISIGPPRPQPRFRPHLAVDTPLVAAHLSCVIAGMWTGVAVLSAAIVGLHAWASMHPRSQWYLPAHWRLDPACGACALTFDDGPHPEHTPRILDLLAAHRQRATFFVIGANIAGNEAILRRMRADGHSIGLHSQRHSRCFNILPKARIRADLERCAKTIAEVTGEAPPRLFRPPVGLRSPQVADVVRDLGLVCTTWSERTCDTRARNARGLALRLERAAKPGAIILCHDGCEPGRGGDRTITVTALGHLLERMSLPSRALIAGDGDRLALIETPA